MASLRGGRPGPSAPERGAGLGGTLGDRSGDRLGRRPGPPRLGARPPARVAVAVRLAVALLALAAVAVLLARVAPADWPRGARDVPAWLGRGSADTRVVALATLAGWCCLARLAYALLAVARPVLTRPACAVGASARAPDARRLARRLLGVSTLVAVVTSGAVGAAPAVADGPDGPFDRPVPNAAPAPPRTRHAALSLRRSDPAPSRAPVPFARASPPTVVVRAGDTLWRIAGAAAGSRASPRAVATAWPRWYAANRAVVGADPNFILPGQRLVPPADDPGGVR